MKTKSNIQLPKDTTHVRVHNGKKHSDFDTETFALQPLADLQDMGDKLEFLKITGKGKRAKRESLGEYIILPTVNREDKSFSGEANVDMGRTVVVESPANGREEITREAMLVDNARVQAILNGTLSPDAFVTTGAMPDTLSAVEDAPIWNLRYAKTFPAIDLRGPSNMLTSFEYVPVRPTIPLTGKPSKSQIIICSDNGLEVGKPFAASYSLLNNGGFINIVESITTALDKLGLKWRITTTGFVQERERMFITVQILDGNLETKIGHREFKAFLNCLNSIPSNSGCTVTFANNSFCVCCRNTFAHALHDGEDAKLHIAVKHTKGMSLALKDVPVIVEAYFSNNQKLFSNLRAFNELEFSLEQAQQYFAAFIMRHKTKGTGDKDLPESLTDKNELSTRSANMVETLGSLFVGNIGTKTNQGKTALDLFSAVTEYYTHMSAGETDDTSKQFESSEHGSGSVNKAEFYQWLVKTLNGDTRGKITAIAKVGDTLLTTYRRK